MPGFGGRAVLAAGLRSRERRHVLRRPAHLADEVGDVSGQAVVRGPLPRVRCLGVGTERDEQLDRGRVARARREVQGRRGVCVPGVGNRGGLEQGRDSG